MPRINRASQFAPFDALKGLSEAIKLKEYEHERVQKNNLSEDEILRISKILSKIKRGDTIFVKYFFDGYIKEITGSAKIFICEGYLLVSDIEINFNDILDIKIIKK